MVSRQTPSPTSFPGRIIFRAARRRYRRRSSPTCATRCSPEAQARRFLRHRERAGRSLRRQPHRGARRAAHARSVGHRRDQDGQGRRRQDRARQSEAVRRGAGGAARSHRRDGGRDHGRAARHRMPRGGACRRERDRPRHRAAARADRRRRAAERDAARFTELGAEFHLAVCEASHNRVLVVQLMSLQHVSWPRRKSDADAAGRASHQRRASRASFSDRNPRCRRRAQADGRPTSR